MHKVRAPSGPLLHSGVSVLKQEWHFPGGVARERFLYLVLLLGKTPPWLNVLFCVMVRMSFSACSIASLLSPKNLILASFDMPNSLSASFPAPLTADAFVLSSPSFLRFAISCSLCCCCSFLQGFASSANWNRMLTTASALLTISLVSWGCGYGFGWYECGW